MADSLNNSYKRVAYILENAPQSRYDNKLLLLLYWQMFDDIPMADTVAKEIIERGTEPETILRSRRKIIETVSRVEDIEAMTLDEIQKVKDEN